MPLTHRVLEPPLDVFSLQCPACEGILKVVKSRTLKRRKESRIILYCENCKAKYRIRLERIFSNRKTV